MGEVIYGTCECCGRECDLIRRTRKFPKVQCECHSPYHFDLKFVCETCNTYTDSVVFGKYTRILIHNKENIILAKELLDHPECIDNI